MTRTFVFFNLGTVVAVIISLLVCTDTKNSAKYTFTHTINGSGWDSIGLTFLLGLLSVQWTMWVCCLFVIDQQEFRELTSGWIFDRTDYDATAHISEEVKRAQVAAPAAIWIAVLGTGIAGWVYNIVFVLCSGDMADTGDLGVSGYAPAQILWMNVPRGLFYVLWAFICTVAFQVSSLRRHETSGFPLHQMTDETPQTGNRLSPPLRTPTLVRSTPSRATRVSPTVASLPASPRTRSPSTPSGSSSSSPVSSRVLRSHFPRASAES